MQWVLQIGRTFLKLVDGGALCAIGSLLVEFSDLPVGVGFYIAHLNQLDLINSNISNSAICKNYIMLLLLQY